MDVAAHLLDMFPGALVADIPDHRVDRMAPAGSGMVADRDLAAAGVVGNRAVVEAVDSSHPSFLVYQILLEE